MIMNKINQLDFSKKDVVNTLLNIIKKHEENELKRGRGSYVLKFGFFDNETDFNQFKSDLDTENLQMLLENNFKFFNWSPDNNNLINEYVWLKYDYMEIYSFNEIKKYINDLNDFDAGYTAEIFKNYEGTINNLLKLSLNY